MFTGGAYFRLLSRLPINCALHTAHELNLTMTPNERTNSLRTCKKVPRHELGYVD